MTEKTKTKTEIEIEPNVKNEKEKSETALETEIIDKSKMYFRKEMSEDETYVLLLQMGYKIIEKTEDEKNVLEDLLKCFEDYAKLKGYNMVFSIDKSIHNKFA